MAYPSDYPAFVNVAEIPRNKLDHIVTTLDNIINDIGEVDPTLENFQRKISENCQQLEVVKMELVGLTANIKGLFESLKED